MTEMFLLPFCSFLESWSLPQWGWWKSFGELKLHQPAQPGFPQEAALTGKRCSSLGCEKQSHELDLAREGETKANISGKWGRVPALPPCLLLALQVNQDKNNPSHLADCLIRKRENRSTRKEATMKT